MVVVVEVAGVEVVEVVEVLVVEEEVAVVIDMY